MIETERAGAAGPPIADSPSLLASGVAMVWSFRLRAPRPSGAGTVDHGAYGELLELTRRRGLAGLAERRADLEAYLATLAALDPDALSRDEALAFWLNLYNAGAQQLALDAYDRGLATVLRVGRAFERPFIEVAGERMSLHDIENGKVRRFGDPRVHAALNCASASCPPLPPEPFGAAELDARLEARMRRFLVFGGMAIDRAAGKVALSRVFEWFGSDFVRPGRMPLLLPSSPRAVLAALARWTDDATRAWLAAVELEVSFQSYDWRLGSAVD